MSMVVCKIMAFGLVLTMRVKTKAGSKTMNILGKALWVAMECKFKLTNETQILFTQVISSASISESTEKLMMLLIFNQNILWANRRIVLTGRRLFYYRLTIKIFCT